jgi:surfeit locus 1 family protein
VNLEAPRAPARYFPARRIAVPALFALAGIAILVSLGIWQLHRKAWKEELIERMSQRLAAKAADLPTPAEWSQLQRDAAEFRRVRFAAHFLNDREALVYAMGSTLRSDASGPGYWVFTPARLEDGATVFVDRGFVPDGRRDRERREPGELEGTIEITGVMRWPEPRGVFTPADDPSHRLWFVRDPGAMAASMELGAVAPFYVEQEAPVPPGGLPSPAKLAANLPNNHLQYAITWFGLAAALLASFASFAWTQWRAGGGELTTAGWHT